MAGPGVAIQIRRMDIADLDSVVALETRIYPQPWALGIFENELARPNRVYLAADDGTGVVGYAGLMMIDEDAQLHLLATEACGGFDLLRRFGLDLSE